MARARDHAAPVAKLHEFVDISPWEGGELVGDIGKGRRLRLAGELRSRLEREVPARDEDLTLLRVLVDRPHTHLAAEAVLAEHDLLEQPLVADVGQLQGLKLSRSTLFAGCEVGERDVSRELVDAISSLRGREQRMMLRLIWAMRGMFES